MLEYDGNLKEEWREGWWEESFPRSRNASEIRGHPKGETYMLIIVAYDVANPKRLKKISDCCKDFGIRVQYSVFECRMEAPMFDKLWERLCSIIHVEEDRIVAYPIHGAARNQIRTLGTMVCSKAVVSYQF
jgi:CRISPR-associated protein Cas2